MQDIVSSSHIFVLLHFLKGVCYCCLFCKLQPKSGGKQFNRLGSELGTEKRPSPCVPSRPTCWACTCSAGRAGEGQARSEVTGHRRAPCRPGGLSAAPSLPPAQPLTLCGARCACPHQRGRVRGWNRCAAESLRTGGSACLGLAVSSGSARVSGGWLRAADWPAAGMARPLRSGSKGLMS